MSLLPTPDLILFKVPFQLLITFKTGSIRDLSSVIISVSVSLIHFYKSLSAVKTSVIMALPVPLIAFKAISDQTTWSISDFMRLKKLQDPS